LAAVIIIYPLVGIILTAIVGLIIYFVFRKSKPIKQTVPTNSSNASDYYHALYFMNGIREYSPIINCTEIPDKLVMIDLETTGLEASTDRIIEIGIIKYENGEVVEKYSQLIDPESRIPNQATAINGITNEMVKDCPKIYDVIDDVYNMISDTIIAGYNIQFDLKFLSAAFTRSNLKLENVVALDVLQIVRETLSSKETPNKKLTTIKEYFNIVNTSHRALSDCEVSFEVLKRCMRIKENVDMQKKIAQSERLSKLNENERLFISTLEERLEALNIKERLNYNVMSDKIINFQIDQMQIGRVKLNGTKHKIQIIDKDNAIWLNVDDCGQAISNIRHWVKYCEYLVK
jgi:DNA polymerase III epsilon subunit family exonuclease